MNRAPASLHRLSTALIALVLLALGGAALASRLGVRPISEWVDRFDASSIGRFADSGWWAAALGGVVVLSLIWGLSLIGSTLRPRAVDDLELDGSDQSGELVIAPKLIATAVADELSGDTMFQKVSARALDDRSRKIIRLEVTARPDRSYAEIVDRVGRATDQIREAVAGADVHVQAFIHLEKPTSAR
ncbi:hypothetical protein nbrc107696_11220 [Gordonia spumicola]|uniref:Alkaline shock response membrane anchor protein AmaP n=1 Tax=Gordonia spumicola TaxID=589161 RepID=A0A7I9V5L1_9ACTN|nr:hypothetical protein [Gordonia spumicola]GEE00676.1 hypothetical protein nbrc107696_11220 [Gordonia spumicola]